MPQPLDRLARNGIRALAILMPCTAHPATGEHETLTVQFEIPSHESLVLRLRDVISPDRIADLIRTYAPTLIPLEKD
jgi:hypothetical protein